jgi:hypothetical protein
MALILLVVVATGLALYVAYDLRRLVGLEHGWDCTLDPAWRVHLTWWLLPIAAGLLVGSAVDMGRTICGRGTGIVALPLLVCVAALAVIAGLNVFALNSFDAECSTPFIYF